LKFNQEDIEQSGHSIECRIYAEDPNNNFMPSGGKVFEIEEPSGLGIRNDGYIYSGCEIPIYYDPLISKLVSWAATRDEALQRMIRALDEYKIIGPQTNISFLKKVVDSEKFRSANYTTNFIEENIEKLLENDLEDQEVLEDLAIIGAFLNFQSKLNKNDDLIQKSVAPSNNWKNIGRKMGTIRTWNENRNKNW